ncbi:MAG: hypothetical protein R8M45_03690 [Ghiorsea sp.]
MSGDTTKIPKGIYCCRLENGWMEICPYGEYEGEDENIWRESARGVEYASNHNTEYGSTLAKIIPLNRLLEIATITNEFADALSGKEMDGIFEKIFGDSVYIIATDTGFDVIEFEHD